MMKLERNNSFSTAISCSEVPHVITILNSTSSQDDFTSEPYKDNKFFYDKEITKYQCVIPSSKTEINCFVSQKKTNELYYYTVINYINNTADLLKTNQLLDAPIKKTTEMVVSLEKNKLGRIASFYVVYFVEKSFRQREYERVNQLLHEIDVNEITEWSMIALLRSSFSARSFLPAWTHLREEVKDKLEAEGKNHKKLLRGLL
ncbi:hypothetical protein ACK32K_11605 [Aeromonas dhakensis]|nr:hypothetical protein [Aeromonas dhakensis]WAF71477.1 hypothetical protein NRK99_15900 [Aeromonas dhakensis]